VRVKLKISSKGVITRDNGWEKVFFFAPGKQGLPGGSKEAVKQESIFIK